MNETTNLRKKIYSYNIFINKVKFNRKIKKIQDTIFVHNLLVFLT